MTLFLGCSKSASKAYAHVLAKSLARLKETSYLRTGRFVPEELGNRSATKPDFRFADVVFVPLVMLGVQYTIQMNDIPILGSKTGPDTLLNPLCGYEEGLLSISTFPFRLIYSSLSKRMAHS